MSDETNTVVEDVVKEAIENGTTGEPAKDDDGITKATDDNLNPADNLEDEGDAADDDDKAKKAKKKPVKKDDDTTDQGAPEPVEIEKGASAWLSAISTLRGSASDMDPSGLELLANIIRYTQYAYGDEDKVRTALTKMGIDMDELTEGATFEDAVGEHDDVEKAMKVIGPTAFGKISTAAQAIITNAQTIVELSGKAREIKKDDDTSGETTEQGDTEVVKEDATDSNEGDQDATEVQKDDSPKDRQASDGGTSDVLAAAGAILLKRQKDEDDATSAAILKALDKVTARLDVIDGRQNDFAAGLKQVTGKQ